MTMTYHITHAQNEMTVERYLLSQGYSQGLIRHLRNTENGLTIGGKLVYTTHRLECGEILTALLNDEESSKHIVPTSMPLHIVYEDQHLLVVNKEAGVRFTHHRVIFIIHWPMVWPIISKKKGKALFTGLLTDWTGIRPGF